MQIVLYVVSPEEYFKTVVSLLKRNFKDDMELIFVTTNKPYKQVVQLFEQEEVKNLDKIYFIDCISRHLSQHIEETKNCFFVESPTDLTNMGIAINETAKQLKQKKCCFWIL